MTRWPRLATSVVPLVAACLFLILWIGSRREARLAATDVAHVRQAYAGAETRVQTLEGQNAVLRSQLEASGLHPAVSPPPPRSASVSATVETVRVLALTQRQLSDTKAALEAAQSRLQQIEASLEQLQSENQRLQTAATEAREEAESLRHVNETVEAELKSKAARADSADEQIRRAQADSAEARQRLNQAAATLHELDEVARRRDNYLNNLLRRYRDANDQLRSLSARLERYRDSSSAPSFSTDLPRLQSVIQASEEDLRQVQNLNAQAQRLSQRLQQIK
jgi:DNA repair exonuclease SbcCD ATPase subunit